MARFLRSAAILGVLLCGGSGAALAASALPAGLPPSAILLLRYDANHDGVITKAEMEAGLKADYAAVDVNHDGCIDRNEMRAENERRLRQDGSLASPLYDWNLDGCVDMAEFASTVRSYFGFVDRTKNGEVTLLELRGPSMPFPVPAEKKNDDKDKGPPPDDDGPGYGSAPGY